MRDFSAVIVCGFILSSVPACSAPRGADRPAQPKPAVAATGSVDDVLRRFGEWTNPALTESTQHQNLVRFGRIQPELSALFSPDARVTMVVKGTREDISPQEFANRIAKIAFTSGPRQIVLQAPTYQTSDDTVRAVTEQYLLDPQGPDISAVVRYELTLRSIAGRAQITGLNAIFSPPTEAQTATAMQRLPK